MTKITYLIGIQIDQSQMSDGKIASKEKNAVDGNMSNAFFKKIIKK